jgi:oligoendopeptidase F
MVHEMGHYYAALYNPDVSSYDLAEVQSQGNEMLFVKYMGGQVNRDIYKAVRGYAVFNLLYATVLGVIVDEFEQRVYSAEGVENFTAADFDAIMKEVCEQYGGFDFIKNNFGDMNEYWRMVAPTSAVYYVSYSMSAMAALSLLVTAEEDEAAAREMYRIIVEDVEEDATFMEAITMAGLLSPFEEEVFKKVVQIAIE